MKNFIELHETMDRYVDGRTLTKMVTHTYLIQVKYITSVQNLNTSCHVEFEGDAGYRTHKIKTDESYETVKRLIAESEANANLIAAVPELLETLEGLHKALSRMIDKHDPDSIEAEWLSHSHEVITKTKRGETK